MLEERIQNHLSIYERMGEKGLWKLAFRAVPWYRKPLVPLVIKEFRQALKDSEDLDTLLSAHNDYYITSARYRLFRPLYRKARKVLSEDYGIQ